MPGRRCGNKLKGGNMFIMEEVEYLLKLPKKIIEKNNAILIKELSPGFPFKYKCELIATDEDTRFILDIEQSKKFQLKITLHHQELQTKIGLLRVDYYGRHRNPEIVNLHVPDKLKKYAGKFFDYYDHHMHVYIEGYKSLAWAYPLSETEASVKTLDKEEILSKKLNEIIADFCRLINLETRIVVNGDIL